MKISATLIGILTLCFTSCSKWDDLCEEPAPAPSCELLASYEIHEGSPVLLFQKELDHTTGKAKKVTAPTYSFAPSELITLQLQYKGNLVYMLGENNLADTFLIATFNQNGQLEIIDFGNSTNESQSYFPAMRFEYTGNRLGRYLAYDGYNESSNSLGNLIQEVMVSYDAHGNVIQLTDSNGQDGDAQTEITYTYDYTVKAAGQFYPEGFGVDQGNSTLYLAQFMGWLPDLMPVNKRTAAKSNWEFVGYDEKLAGHQYDASRNLTSYHLGDPDYGYSNVWSCSTAN